MRTLPPTRATVNTIETRKRQPSRQPDEHYELIKTCSPGDYLELFAHHRREVWTRRVDCHWVARRPRRLATGGGAGVARRTLLALIGVKDTEPAKRV